MYQVQIFFPERQPPEDSPTFWDPKVALVLRGLKLSHPLWIVLHSDKAPGALGVVVTTFLPSYPLSHLQPTFLTMKNHMQPNKFTKALRKLRGVCGEHFDQIMGVVVVEGLNELTTYKEEYNYNAEYAVSSEMECVYDIGKGSLDRVGNDEGGFDEEVWYEGSLQERTLATSRKVEKQSSQFIQGKLDINTRNCNTDGRNETLVNSCSVEVEKSVGGAERGFATF